MVVRCLRMIQSKLTSHQPLPPAEINGGRKMRGDNYLRLASLFLKVGQELVMLPGLRGAPKITLENLQRLVVEHKTELYYKISQKTWP